MQEKIDESFGVVLIFKPRKEAIQLLVVRHAASHWGFPKGHRENDETPLQTAARELAEETGITNITLSEQPQFTHRYDFEQDGILYHKTVTYFTGYTPTKTVTLQPEEIIDYAWATIEEARSLLVVDGRNNEAIDKFMLFWQTNFSNI